MIKTPISLRLHIGVFGRRNAGKSSLINTITGQETSIVSEIKGTTTDPVTKAMEIPGIGPVVFIDTPGFDDEGTLGLLRNKKTKAVIDKCDLILFLIEDEEDLEYIDNFKDKRIIYIYSKVDIEDRKTNLKTFEDLNPIPFISYDNNSKMNVINKIKEAIPWEEERKITADLVEENDIVLLLVPQDIQAPKGRLILPQVQTIRELLDERAVVIAVTKDQFTLALDNLKKPPKLIITDSQCFSFAKENKPEESLLTSFSILFSAFKGDIEYFIESVKILDKINEKSRILIAEACTHPPLEEDIGRVKIPNMLYKKYGDNLQIDFVRGADFKNASNYDLIIHCGSCMFNRTQMMSRVSLSKNKEIPMTNYGVLIAYLQGIMDDVCIPGMKE